MVSAECQCQPTTDQDKQFQPRPIVAGACAEFNRISPVRCWAPDEPAQPIAHACVDRPALVDVLLGDGEQTRRRAVFHGLRAASAIRRKLPKFRRRH
jgi:hypothetical protein